MKYLWRLNCVLFEIVMLLHFQCHLNPVAKFHSPYKVSLLCLEYVMTLLIGQFSMNSMKIWFTIITCSHMNLVGQTRNKLSHTHIFHLSTSRLIFDILMFIRACCSYVCTNVQKYSTHNASLNLIAFLNHLYLPR